MDPLCSHGYYPESKCYECKKQKYDGILGPAREEIYRNWDHIMTVAIRNGDLDFTDARELTLDMLLSGLIKEES